jgi:DNA helicase II / ATP-dependent DNA helicase PcrA
MYLLMTEFEKQFGMLNPEQRKAVEHTEGPVLVIAGPGTGKTQLLSTRAAYILQNTDASAHNILCLTYTESGAFAMRQRLVNIIGQKAYNITISTYHAFGSELINRFPEHFSNTNEMTAVDDLGIHSILSKIISKLPYDNPLKKSEFYINDIIGSIGDCKKALLTPASLLNVAKSNIVFIDTVSKLTKKHLATVSRIDKRSISAFENLATDTAKISAKGALPNTKSIQELWQEQLEAAIENATESGKTTPITEWKNTWLEKDSNGVFIPTGKNAANKLLALSGIYESYLAELEKQGLYDYDDMILQAIEGLKSNKGLRYTLQEQYLYIMLDEFQDTNGAQLELVKLLTDSPVYEGRPNILAVGDDDQAIFSFQGADYSHMATFVDMYRDPIVVTLTKNYRSHSDILHTAHNVSTQIEERLHHKMDGIDKFLKAENKDLPSHADIERHEFKSDVAQFAWVTKQITDLIKKGTSPNEIAIIAPKHKYLEPIVPYLAKAGVPVRYEKRENILNDPAILQIIRMSQLISAVKSGNSKIADSIWPEVLSYDFWEIPIEEIWKLSWKARETKNSWIDIIMSNDSLKPIGLFFLRLGNISTNEMLESIMDYLIGTTSLSFHEKEISDYTCPYFKYYFGDKMQGSKQRDFWNLLSNLTVLRQHLRAHRGSSGRQLYMDDFINFVDEHVEADIKILNTSPYHESAQAVQIMTVYKAKGLEFQAVFMLACIDEAWGSKASARTAKVPLPVNLTHIRYSGATDDEKLRLLFVAITRAKHSLFMTSYTNTYANRPTSRIKFFDETEHGGNPSSGILPTKYQEVHLTDSSLPSIDDLSAYWADRHIELSQDVRFKDLLAPRLERFQLAPTNLNSFTDLVYGGPKEFFLNTLLRFPSAPTAAGEFGDAVHATIEWLHIQLKLNGKLPNLPEANEQFAVELSKRNLSDTSYELMKDRGEKCFKTFLAQKADTFNPEDLHEYDFRKEGVLLGPAHLTGKIDKMIIDKQSKTISIVDFKTGSSYKTWKTNDPKLHKYKQQLYMYKLLVEGSYTFADYNVKDAYLQFVEPNDEGEIVDLHLAFDSDELKRTRDIAIAVWKRIQKLDLPDVTNYEKTMKGIRSFEDDLIKS